MLCLIRDWDECSYKRDPRELSCPLHKKQKKDTDYELGGGLSEDTKSDSTFILGFQAPRTVRNKVLLFRKHSIYGNFNMVAQMDEASPHGKKLRAAAV